MHHCAVPLTYVVLDEVAPVAPETIVKADLERLHLHRTVEERTLTPARELVLRDLEFVAGAGDADQGAKRLRALISRLRIQRQSPLHLLYHLIEQMFG